MLPGEDLFTAIDDVIEFCTLLQNPDNWIRVASGQYVQTKRPLRTVADMTNEMEQELVSLPRFTAYAKLIKEQGGEQKTVKRKIKTRKLPEPKEVKIGDLTLSNMRHVDTTACTRHRESIETEIRERQNKWRRRELLSQMLLGEPPERPPPRDA